MSTQEHSNTTVMPAPDMTMVLDGEEEEVVDLEAIAREAAAKPEKNWWMQRHGMTEPHGGNKRG